jgi:hypothetical protein
MVIGEIARFSASTQAIHDISQSCDVRVFRGIDSGMILNPAQRVKQDRVLAVAYRRCHLK